jgi:hypothetical protein
MNWDLEHVCKLHGLPSDTTPANLIAALKEKGIKVDFVEIPKYYFNNGNNVRYRREAFIYFNNEEDKLEAMKIQIKIGWKILFWLGVNERRCYTCNNNTHGWGKCPVRKQELENRAHQKRIMEYHMASKSNMRTGKTFADLFKGKSKNYQNNNNKEIKNVVYGETRKTNQSVNLDLEKEFPKLENKSETERNGTKEQSNVDASIAQHMEKQKTLEKKMGEMQNTIKYLMEKQTEVMTQMNTMMQNLQYIMIQMSSMGKNNEAMSMTQRSDTPLVDNRTTKKIKREKEAAAALEVARQLDPRIPSPNASRAGIEAIITARKNESNVFIETQSDSTIDRNSNSNNQL